MSPIDPEQAATVARLRRTLAVLLGLLLATSAGLALLALRGSGGSTVSELIHNDEELRDEALRELVSSGAGVYDSHQDPDVGRVLQPGIEEREYAGVPVSSNSFGMREEEYSLAKPEGTTRVVLLGDSFVFGYGVRAEERLGVFLREALETRASGGGPFEVLHLGISSWNVLAECSYLRRQLSLLRPDLVVHVTVTNDLSDTKGLRGFGSVAGYSSQVRERANGLVKTSTSRLLWTTPLRTQLANALDHEGRTRYARAAAEIGRLARAVEAIGGRYLHLGGWSHHNSILHTYLEPELREEQLAYLSPPFSEDPRYILGSGNDHWNPTGHRVVAQLLYGLLQERDLLSGVVLTPWTEAAQAVREIHEPGLLVARNEALRAGIEARARKEIRSSIDFEALTGPTATQVYGGVDGNGLAAPYVSLVIANDGASQLVVSGKRLGRPELPSGTATVWLEEERVGEVTLGGDGDFELSWPIPASLSERRWLNVRFQSSDFIYRKVARGNCASFVLKKVALR